MTVMRVSTDHVFGRRHVAGQLEHHREAQAADDDRGGDGQADPRVGRRSR